MRTSLVCLGLAVALALLAGCRASVRACLPCAQQPVDTRAVATSIDCCGRCGWRDPCTGRLKRKWAVEVEVGPVWTSRNDVAVPGDTGTRFALDDVTGSGPFPWGRATLDYQIAPRHSIRALVAPLYINETGTLSQPVSFQGQNFAAGVPTEATYKFNSYRLTYRYRLWHTCKWTVNVGATAKIRDAKIELVQGGQRATETDVGFVPLLHVDAEYRISNCWRMTADLDGAAAPQGRAFDFALKLHRDINERWSVGFGYRLLEGGADNDTVFTFAWLHQALVSATYRF